MEVLVGGYLQHVEGAHVPGYGLGVSVAAESNHDQVVAVWFHCADRGGGVPGLYVGYDLVLSPYVEESVVARAVGRYQDAGVGNVADDGDDEVFYLVPACSGLVEARGFQAVEYSLGDGVSLRAVVCVQSKPGCLERGGNVFSGAVPVFLALA